MIKIAKGLFLGGCCILVAFGTAHGIGTLLDKWGIPTMFWPTDKELQKRMAQPSATLEISPHTNLWNSWIGFNLSHSIGVMFFGIVLARIALYDFELLHKMYLFPWIFLWCAFFEWLCISLGVRAPSIGIAISFLCFFTSFYLSRGSHSKKH